MCGGRTDQEKNDMKNKIQEPSKQIEIDDSSQSGKVKRSIPQIMLNDAGEEPSKKRLRKSEKSLRFFFERKILQISEAYERQIPSGHNGHNLSTS